MTTISRTVTHPDGREATITEQLEATNAAWLAARTAIEEAWKLTPGFLLHTRRPISRNAKTQTIAYDSANSMAANAQRALDAIRRNKLARERGYKWTTETDEEAARENWDRI